MADTQPPPKSIAVRELAQLIHRRGDIHVRFERGTTGPEGVATQKRVQRSLYGDDSDYEREYAVALDFHAGSEAWHLGGRVDGCNPVTGLVEEYKTTRADITRIHAHLGHVHLAQLKLYGALLALKHPEHSRWELALCYCHPEQDAVVERFTQTLAMAELQAFLTDTLDAWRERLAAYNRYLEARDLRLASLPFPFESFRPNQRALAGKVYTGLKAGRNLLLEAATGTGKSLATLYPAYRALADTQLQRVFFLTSRTTGQDAAQAAAALLQDASQSRAVTIIAKDKACLVPGMPCDPDGCEFARGYYDRLPAALEAGLAAGHSTPDDVEALARAHTLCPFELSLDLSRWCDLVIMDYNYLFDPVVRLQRFGSMPDAAILIDEAHQLEQRVRSMLSASLPKREISAVVAKDSAAPEVIRKAARTLSRSFTRATKALIDPATAASGGGSRPTRDFDDVQVRNPSAFTDRVGDFIAAVTELGDDAFASECVTALFFSALRWQRAQDWLELGSAELAGNAAAFYQRSSQTLQLLCLDGSAHIAQTLANYGPNAQFSGTLSPLTVYQQLHGDPDAQIARVEAGDLRERLGLYIVPDVPTLYRSRTESLPRLMALTHTVISAKPGNYFIAFPSFAYLEQFCSAFGAQYPQHLLRIQQRASGLAEREAFVAHFRGSTTPTLGCVVLGGVFTESLDFADDALLGVIVVSVALPPPDNAREALAGYYRAQGNPHLGQVVAYRQPAMVRVIQAAGRVVRNDTDRGIVCLVDSRFQTADFAALQPAHWHPEVVKSQALAETLASFWQTTPAGEP